MQKVPSPRLLLNYLIRTVGHKKITAPKEAWAQLARIPYSNNLFDVVYDKDSNMVHFKTDPTRSTHLMLAIKYSKQGVQTSVPLIEDGNNLILNGKMCDLPTRWFDMLYEYYLCTNYVCDSDFAKYYNLSPYYDPTDVKLESIYDEYFTEFCNDEVIMKRARYNDYGLRTKITDQIDNINNQYGKRFNNPGDDTYNRYFHKASLKYMSLKVLTGPEVPIGYFTPAEMLKRQERRIFDPTNYWEMGDQNASPSSAYFADICKTAPNDYKQYRCDIATSGGGIGFPNSSYHLASVMITPHMRGVNHIDFHNELDLSNNYYPNGSITNEDLVVLAEDIKKYGGESLLTV
jgi:hypothetical protein